MTTVHCVDQCYTSKACPYLATHADGDCVVDGHGGDADGGGGGQRPANADGPVGIHVGPGRPLVVELRVLDDTHQEDGLRTAAFMCTVHRCRHIHHTPLLSQKALTILDILTTQNTIIIQEHSPYRRHHTEYDYRTEDIHHKSDTYHPEHIYHTEDSYHIENTYHILHI